MILKILTHLGMKYIIAGIKFVNCRDAILYQNLLEVLTKIHQISF